MRRSRISSRTVARWTLLASLVVAQQACAGEAPGPPDAAQPSTDGGDAPSSDASRGDDDAGSHAPDAAPGVGDAGPGDERMVVARGAGFGEGPRVVFWFSGRNAGGREVVDLAEDPEIGAFGRRREGSGSVETEWRYWADEASGRTFVPTIDNDGEGGSYFSRNVSLGSPRAEAEGVLVSYRAYVPPGYGFPGVSLGGWAAGDYEGVGSSFKSAWLTHDGDDTGNGDLVLWTHSGGGSLTSSGNGASWGLDDRGTHWVASLSSLNTGDHSPRLLAFMQVPADFRSGDEVSSEWSLASTSTHRYFEGQRPLSSNRVPIELGHVAFAGWADPERNGHGSVASSQVLYGDLYIAQGPTARARIELGDAARYEDCGWLFIAPPDGWTDEEVRATFHADELARATHWFVTTADGRRYSGPLGGE